MTPGDNLGVHSCMLPSGGGLLGCPISALDFPRAVLTERYRDKPQNCLEDYRLVMRDALHQLFYLAQFLLCIMGMCNLYQ